jgi:hypothetical protein
VNVSDGRGPALQGAADAAPLPPPPPAQATIEWESQDDGFVAKLLVPEGTSNIEVGTPVLVIADSADDVPAFASFSPADAAGGAAPAAAAAEAPTPAPAAAPEAPAAPLQTPSAAPRRSAAPAPAPGGRVVASPYARKLAAEAGVSLAGVAGSGPGGRVVAADVQQLVASGGGAPAAAAEAGAPAPAYPYADYTDVPNSQIRKVTARRLLESKQQVPHYYLTVTARVDALQRLRWAGGRWWGAGDAMALPCKAGLWLPARLPAGPCRAGCKMAKACLPAERPGTAAGRLCKPPLLHPTNCRQQLNATLAAGNGGKLSLNDFVIKVGPGEPGKAQQQLLLNGSRTKTTLSSCCRRLRWRCARCQR